MPDILSERPELTQWCVPYWNAFQRLSGSRPIGMAAGSIPLSEIVAYCTLYGISDPNDIDDLVYVIGEMDSEWLDGVNPKE